MKYFILASDYADSANRLARYMQCGVSSKVRDIPGDCGVLIRWGSVKETPPTFRGLELNRSLAIRNSSHKLSALQTLDASGVNVPRYATCKEGATRLHFPIIARPLYHTRGIGFYFLRNSEELHGFEGGAGYYFTEYICKDREFRAFTVGSNILWIDRKQRERDGTERIHNSCWNYENGYRFRALPGEGWGITREAIKVLCENGARSLGLDLAAWDIISIPYDGERKFYILEANTAAALSVRHARMTATYIQNLYS